MCGVLVISGFIIRKTRFHYGLALTCQHGTVKVRWKVVVEVQNTPHGIERKVMQCPAKE